MIPVDAVYPDESAAHAMPRKSPFLSMTDLYQAPGAAEASVVALEGMALAHALLTAEFAYCRGDIDAVYEKANYFLQEHSGPFAILSGGMLLAQCAMWKGDMELFLKAKMHICELPCRTEVDRSILELSLAAADLTIRDLRNFPDWFKKGYFSRLPADAHPAAKVYYIKCLMIYAQDLAMDKFSREGMQGLALMRVLPNTIEPFIAQAEVDKTILVEAHLRLMCAVVCHNGGDTERAVFHIDKAIALLMPDGLLGPLAEYRRQLGYLLDDRLALVDPEAVKEVKNLHKRFNQGWTKLHNAVLEKTISVELSPREREVARLAAFGLSDGEIASQLNLSKSTVKSLLSMAKNKTGSIKRAELVAYI